MSKIKKIYLKIEKIFTIGLLILSFLAAIFMGFALYKFENLDNMTAFESYSSYEIPTTLYDIKKRKITEFFLYKRKILKFEDIPKNIINTLLIAEDKKFYEHSGIDLSGIMRAMLKNIKSGAIKQGGSTITQQLAKLLFTQRKKTIARKIKELWLTLQLEKKYKKNEILEKYFNKVYYSNNQYGLETASIFYFGKKAKKLNYAESAFLVAIPPAPTYFNPLRYPMRTKRRQKIILNNLVKHKHLTKEEMEKQYKEFWLDFQERLISGSFYNRKSKNKDKAPYFSEYIRREMYEIFEDALYTGGYKIYTTLNIDYQNIAKKALQKKLKDQEKKYKKSAKKNFLLVQKNYPRLVEFLGYAFNMPELEFYKSELEKQVSNYILKEEISGWGAIFPVFNMQPQNLVFEKRYMKKEEFQLDYNPEGALVSMEVKTGRLLSMVGGSGYSPFNQLNRAYQSRRQPGSSFKPFIYLSALLSKKYSPAHTINDSPIAYKIESGDIWIPGNAGTNYQGKIRLRAGLRKSVNIVSIRLIEALGISPVVNVASKVLGLDDDRFRKDFSLALGTSEVSPLELMKGYGVFANKGKEVYPHGVIKVEDRYGNEIWNPEKDLELKKAKQLIDPRYIFILTDMMRDVIKRGTATEAALRSRFFYPAAGKTGTSSNFRDAWFSGFTPNVVTTVWIGFDKAVSLGDWKTGTGGRVAAPVWMDYMKQILKNYPVRGFYNPGGIIRRTVCTVSGHLPGDDCKDKVFIKYNDKGEPIFGAGFIDEYFIPGTEPSKTCAFCKKEFNVSDDELKKMDNLIDDDEG